MYFIYSNIDKIISILTLISLSICLRILLQIIGQSWIKTIAHTATLTLLPILTYVIVSVISGNIALSLGMVGALSIVRFRNPVRSPLELSVYFGAITMGIAAAVSLKWLLLLVAAVTLVAFVLTLINLVTNRLSNKPFFISSFSEGNNLSNLTITAEQEVPMLNNSELLMSKTVSSDEVTYILAHPGFTVLQDIEQKVRTTGLVKKLQLSR